MANAHLYNATTYFFDTVAGKFYFPVCETDVDYNTFVNSSTHLVVNSGTIFQYSVCSFKKTATPPTCYDTVSSGVVFTQTIGNIRLNLLREESGYRYVGYRLELTYNNNTSWLRQFTYVSSETNYGTPIFIIIAKTTDNKYAIANINYNGGSVNNMISGNGIYSLIEIPNNGKLGYCTYECTTTYDTQYRNTVGYSSENSAIANEILNFSNPIVSDPYADAGDSTTGGGDGTFDGSSDPVPVPSLPTVGATDTGFITLFVPSQAQLKSVAQYLWGGLFDISTYKRLFEDPMDCILGLSVVPVSVPTSGSAAITVGNIELSGITLPVASQQYVEVDCGTVDFASNRFFGSYLDFEPYTKMSLFVPYSGVHSVSADDIIGKTVGLKYHIDILTGSLVAFLTCGNSVLYEFNGACASNIPVNSMNYASTIENAIRIAVNIGTTVATAGASAPTQGISQAQQTARNIGTGVSLAGSTTEGALSLKPNIDRAGSLGGTTGLMGNQIPYFIITRPRLCKPKDQDKFQGYPSFINSKISDLIGTGFTSFTNIILENSFLTDAENDELLQLLQGGVYL